VGSRVEVMPARCTARHKIPFSMSWRSVSQGGTTHGMVEVGMAKGCPTAALHGGGVGGQHGQAKTVPEAGLDLSALELQSSREREIDQPSRYILRVSFNKHIGKKQGTSAKRLLHQTCKFQIENQPP
jgi:hypothetical protein